KEVYGRLTSYPSVHLPVAQLNERTGGGATLTLLEAEAMATLIEHFSPETVIIDCPSRNRESFKEHLLSLLSYAPEIVLAFKAELTYAVVGAASIVAKVERDMAVEMLGEVYNIAIGSGYPHDPLTKKCLQDHKFLPIFRTHWKTYKESGQRLLMDMV